jgi:hypothetical protein
VPHNDANFGIGTLDGRRSYIPRRTTATKYELSRIENRE